MNKKLYTVGIGYGTINLRDDEALEKCIKAAQEANYDFIDCAWRYGNEAKIGLTIKRIESADSSFDFKLGLQSKVWPSQYKGGINKALRLCLQKLGQLPEIDCYMLHRPSYDVETTISAWKQLVDCKRQRLVRSIGVSNFDKDLILTLYEATNYLPEFNQVELSVNNMRYDRISFCKKRNIKIQAYSPLGQLEENLKNEIILKIAKKHNATVPQILLAFLINLGIEPIVASKNPEHVVENAKARNIILSAAEVAELKTINTHNNKHPETLHVDLNEIDRAKVNAKVKILLKKRD